MRTSLLGLAAAAAVAAGVVGVGEKEGWQPSGTGSLAAETSQDSEIETQKSERLQQPSVLPVQLVEAGATAPANVVPNAPATQPSVATKPAHPVVDESALRYFATRGDTVRLQAEISRLRALYPGWEPPADPLAIADGGDPQLDAMWKLYSEGRYDDVTKAIADRQKNEPDWSPPTELVDSMRLATTRRLLVQASDAHQNDRVVDLASQAPQLLTCSEVDILWRVGEAFAKTNRPDRARDAYSYILQNCHNPQERLATIQKASLVLDIPHLDGLMKLEQTGTDGKPEFDAIRTDIARSLVSRGGTDPKAVVPQDYVTRLAEDARATGSAADSLLLGWYFYRRNQLDQAQDWFRRSFDKEPAAIAAQGLALTQVAVGDPQSAENTLYRFRDATDETKAAYLSAVANLLAQDPPKAIDNAVLARMATPVVEARNTAAAEQFGWYARALQQMQTAADWFGLILSWDASYEPAAYGLALSLDALGDRAGVARIQAVWGQRSERIAHLRDPKRATAQPTIPAPVAVAADTERPVQHIRPGGFVLTDAAPAATPVRVAAGNPPAERRVRPRGCTGGTDLSRTAPADALRRGWCLMDLKRPLEAAAAFDRAMTATVSATRQEAAYGKSLAYLRLNLTDKAAVAAVQEQQTPVRAKQLQVAILADRAVGAFRLGRFNETIIALDQRSRLTREPQDLMMLRASAYRMLGYESEARRLLQPLANVGNSDAIKALYDKPT